MVGVIHTLRLEQEPWNDPELLKKHFPHAILRYAPPLAHQAPTASPFSLFYDHSALFPISTPSHMLSICLECTPFFTWWILPILQAST